MATKSQEILLKGNTTNASAVPSSLKVREIAINALDRSLFTNDGNSIVKLYTGTNKWFDVNGNANNALKLGGILASEYINKEAFNSHINNSTLLLLQRWCSLTIATLKAPLSTSPLMRELPGIISGTTTRRQLRL